MFTSWSAGSILWGHTVKHGKVRAYGGTEGRSKDMEKPVEFMNKEDKAAKT